jgi:hypothetical protein
MSRNIMDEAWQGCHGFIYKRETNNEQSHSCFGRQACACGCVDFAEQVHQWNQACIHNDDAAFDDWLNIFDDSGFSAASLSKWHE